MNDFVDGFHFVLDNWSLVWPKTLAHLELSAEAVLIAVLIGVPLGVFLGHIHRFSFVAINISNLGRALPSLAVLAILLPVFGIGTTDVIIALVVLAAPPIFTNAYVAVDQVDPDTVDAAKGIGLRPRQVLMKVELPLALPIIFAGIRTSAVFVVATATLAGFFGGGGLGDIISNAASYHISGVIGASYVLIVLAFASQALFILIEWLVTPTSLRSTNSLGAFIQRQRSATAPLGAPGATSDADPDGGPFGSRGPGDPRALDGSDRSDVPIHTEQGSST